MEAKKEEATTPFLSSVLMGFKEKGGAIRKLILNMILRVFPEYVCCEFDERKVGGSWH